MIRAIISAFVAYVAMVVCALVGIAALWHLLGNEFAFAGETTMASTGWSIAMLLAGLASAVVGGCVAALVGGRKGRLAVRVLISLVVIFGTLTCIEQLGAKPHRLPPHTASSEFDSVAPGPSAVSPLWYNVAIVFVGGIGVWLGGRLCLTPPTRKAPDTAESANPRVPPRDEPA